MTTLIKQVQGYVRSQNNAGKTGLAMVQACIVHMFDHRDWTPLAWLLAKSDDRDSSIFRAIVGQCTDGITLSMNSKEAKNQPSGMVIKMTANARMTNEASILAELVAEGESFRGTAVRERLLKKEAKAFDLDAYVKRLLSKLEKEHISLKQVLETAAKIAEVNAKDEPKPEVKAVAA